MVLELAERIFAQLNRLPAAQLCPELAQLREALRACDDPGLLEAVAAALPRRVATLAPETCAALCELALELARHGAGAPDDLDQLAPPALRVAWLRVGLTALDPVRPGPRELELSQLDDAQLLLALAEPERWSLLDARAPQRLLARMSSAADPRLRARASSCLRELVEHLALSPAEAFACLEVLAEDPLPELRETCLELFAAPWLACLPAADQTRRKRRVAALLEREALDPRTLPALLRLATALELRAPILALASDGARTPHARALALGALGALAREDELVLALELAAAAPLEYAACARLLVLEAHRHGVFVRAPLLPLLLACFDAHGAWTGVELARVTHIVRDELLAELAKLDADDHRWLRRASIFSASVAAGAPRVLAELLARTGELEVAAALLEAAARTPGFDDEAALLAWLPRLPDHVIPVLALVGSAAAETELLALVEAPSTPPTLRAAAFSALWGLSRARGPLLERLREKLELRVLAGILRTIPRAGLGEDLSARLLAAAHADADAETPADTQTTLALLERLCQSDDIELLPAITHSFRRVFRAYVAAALAGDFTIKRERMPALEQLLFNYGSALQRTGRRVQSWVEGQPKGGRELIVLLTSQWLHEQPEPALSVALLETLTRHRPRGPSLRRIEGLWRHSKDEVRRAAIEAIIGTDGDDEATRAARARQARGLELSLTRLVNSEAPRLMRQGLVAAGRLRARWAEPLVIAALEHPRMLIKKEAASTLALIGSARCVPALIDWVARHDNAGLRERLLAALDAVTGPASLALLVDQLDQARELGPRERNLLHAAISRHLTQRAALRLAGSAKPEHAALIEQVLAGEVALCDSSATRLARALHRAKLRPVAPDAEEPTQAMRRAGFSDAGARALLELEQHEDPQKRPARAALLALVRANEASWLSWTRGLEDGPHARALALALALAGAGTHDAALTPELLEQLEQTLADARPAATEPELITQALRWIERQLSKAEPALRLRALALLRTLPQGPALAQAMSGPRRYALLAKLGGLHTRADLDSCLDACRLSPRFAQDSCELLREAIHLPPAHAREHEEQCYGVDAATALRERREQLEQWYSLPPEQGAAWLDETLDAYPLGVPALSPAPLPAAPRAGPSPSQRERLDALLRELDGNDPGASRRAAQALLAWPDARDERGCWARVLSAYLDARIELGRDERRALATELKDWPGQAERQQRARALLPLLSPATSHSRLSTWLPAWIEAWSQRADPEAEALLRTLDQQLLIPHARARAQAGDYALLRILWPSNSAPMRALVDFVATSLGAPDEVAHLRPTASAPSNVVNPDAPLVDPIAGLDLRELVALVEDRKVELGLGVRAIHALARIDEGGADAVEPFVVDRRPRIRSAALRALRARVPRERSLAASTRMLEIETREQVIAELMASLGHRRYEPAFAQMLEYLTHRNTHLRDAAARALRGWGPSVLPKLRRAAAKARPDRRRIYLAFAEENF